jgi:hypothetical protein
MKAIVALLLPVALSGCNDPVASDKKPKPIYSDVYLECFEERRSMTVCDAFGQGQLPPIEYMRTNINYDRCLARGGSTAQCDAGVRVMYRDIQRSLAEEAQRKAKEQKECLAATKGNAKGVVDCFDPDKSPSK